MVLVETGLGHTGNLPRPDRFRANGPVVSAVELQIETGLSAMPTPPADLKSRVGALIDQSPVGKEVVPSQTQPTSGQEPFQEQGE